MNLPSHPAFACIPAPAQECHVVVVIPVRNEEDYLWQTLAALRMQRTLHGQTMDRRSFEVLLLLNDCSDGSKRIAKRFRATYPEFVLHVAQWTFAKNESHVGSARSLLMHEAARRLAHSALDEWTRSTTPKLLLTTDADTVVDPYWIAETLRCIELGADAVGGDILTRAEDRRDLPRRARLAYVLDRRYRRAIARLESLLDPQQHDAWPRHQHHFGGSMACTLEAYQRSGGMQPVPVLEDITFYHALLACGARFRHEPRVRVHTSARMQGRATIGMSEQLSQWKHRGELKVCATELIAAAFRTRALLRLAMQEGIAHDDLVSQCAAKLNVSPSLVRDTICMNTTVDGCWRALDGELRIRALFPPQKQEGNMREELCKLQEMISRVVRCAEEDPSDMLHVDALQEAATMAG